MDNIKTWTGLPVEESIRMTEDTDKWRKYVHGVANSGIEDGEKNRTEHRMGLRPRPQLTPVYLISMVRTGSARQVVLHGRAVGRFITACPGARVRPVSMDVAIAGGRDGAQGRRISRRLPIAARAV